MANKEVIKNWIIGIGGSNMDGVAFCRMTGSKEDVKERLFNAVLGERNLADNIGYFDFGTYSAEDVTEREDGCLYAYNCFSDYHTDYEAIPEENILVLKEAYTNGAY